MPNTITHNIPVEEVKRGDEFGEFDVVKIRGLEVNVELTLKRVGEDTTTTKRIRRGTLVDIVRIEPTTEEKIEALIAKRDEAALKVREAASNAVQHTPNMVAAKDQLLTATDLLNELEWRTEDIMQSLHEERLLMTLHRMFENGDENDTPAWQVVLNFLDRCKRDLIEWRVGRSTSPGHNLSDDAKRSALSTFVSGFQRFEIGRIEWSTEKIAELQAS